MQIVKSKPDNRAKIKRIVFVWNADFSIQGGLRALSEVASNQHTCTLCEIAYHRVRQTKHWKSYKKSLNVEVREPCKNQLSSEEKKASESDYPTVLAHVDNTIVKLLSSEDIDSCDADFDLFREKLDKRIDELVRKEKLDGE